MPMGVGVGLLEYDAENFFNVTRVPAAGDRSQSIGGESEVFGGYDNIGAVVIPARLSFGNKVLEMGLALPKEETLALSYTKEMLHVIRQRC